MTNPSLDHDDTALDGGSLGDPPSTTVTARKPFNIWPLVPFVVIGASMFPLITMVVTAYRINPEPVVERAYLDAQTYNEQAAARERFTAAGLEFRTAGLPSQAIRVEVAGMDGPAVIDDAVVELYRASDPGLDRLVRWDDTQRSLDIPVPIGGYWEVRLRGRHDGEPVAANRTLREVPHQP